MSARSHFDVEARFRVILKKFYVLFEVTLDYLGGSCGGCGREGEEEPREPSAARKVQLWRQLRPLQNRTRWHCELAGVGFPALVGAPGAP